MEKYLLVELEEWVEVSPLSDQELLTIKPLLAQIAHDKYKTVKSNGQADMDDAERYGVLPGFNVLSRFLPETGIDSIVKIQVVEVKETLLA